MAKISIRISDLEELLTAARERYERDSSEFAYCVDIEVVDVTDVHGASDTIKASLQSGWADCNPTQVYTNKK